jgi:hypothetical protein
MRENRPYGSEGGEVKLPDPYQILCFIRDSASPRANIQRRVATQKRRWKGKSVTPFGRSG